MRFVRCERFLTTMACKHISGIYYCNGCRQNAHSVNFISQH